MFRGFAPQGRMADGGGADVQNSGRAVNLGPVRGGPSLRGPEKGGRSMLRPPVGRIRVPAVRQNGRVPVLMSQNEGTHRPMGTQVSSDQATVPPPSLPWKARKTSKVRMV